MKYRFIEKQQKDYPVSQLCAALGITRSSYYAWKKRQPSQRDRDTQILIEHIRRIHKLSRKTYGSPRVHASLRNQGLRCGKKRVARIMRQNGLQGRRKHRRVRTTDSKHAYPVAPNLLNQSFQANEPNRKWVADITYIPTAEGWLYLAVIMDLFSRRIVGWAMSDQITADLVENALRMALFQRQPEPGLLHHSDRGSQYASEQIQKILVANHIQISMSRTGNCYDNAAMESFFSTIKCEWVHLQKYASRAQARADIFAYIEGFYNPVRIHSSLGYLSPAMFESQFQLSP
jgi:transposase InsO family protein